MLPVVPLSMSLPVVKDYSTSDEVSHLARGQELGTAAGSLPVTTVTITEGFRDMERKGRRGSTGEGGGIKQLFIAKNNNNK